jgi:hypothetical protein
MITHPGMMALDRGRGTGTNLGGQSPIFYEEAGDVTLQGGRS